MARERVLILDTSLRDGEQAPGCSMNTEEKLVLARKLQQLGVDIIEAGFPIASAGDADAVRRVATDHEFIRLADRKKHVYEQDLLSMLFAQRSNMSHPQAAQEMRT